MWLMMVIGCAHRLGLPGVQLGEPEPIPIVRTSIDQRWFAPMTIRGVDHVWFVDTGYTYTTCDDGLVQMLGLETGGRTHVRGETGTLRATKATLPTFRIGGHTIEGLSCQVRDLNTTSSIQDPREVRIAGVIGMDVWRSFQTTFDPEVGQIWLHPRERPLPDGEPLRLRRDWWFGTRTRFAVELGDGVLRPVVDTGATRSFLNATRRGMVPSRTREGMIVRGSGGSSSVTRTLTYFEDVSLGLGSLTSPPVRVTGSERGHGLLGLDVLRNYRITYDFRTRTASVTPVQPSRRFTWARWRAAQRPPRGTELP